MWSCSSTNIVHCSYTMPNFRSQPCIWCPFLASSWAKHIVKVGIKSLGSFNFGTPSINLESHKAPNQMMDQPLSEHAHLLFKFVEKHTDLNMQGRFRGESFVCPECNQQVKTSKDHQHHSRLGLFFLFFFKFGGAQNKIMCNIFEWWGWVSGECENKHHHWISQNQNTCVRKNRSCVLRGDWCGDLWCQLSLGFPPHFPSHLLCLIIVHGLLVDAQCLVVCSRISVMIGVLDWALWSCLQPPGTTLVHAYDLRGLPSGSIVSFFPVQTIWISNIKPLVFFCLNHMNHLPIHLRANWTQSHVFGGLSFVGGLVDGFVVVCYFWIFWWILFVIFSSGNTKVDNYISGC